MPDIRGFGSATRGTPDETQSAVEALMSLRRHVSSDSALDPMRTNQPRGTAIPPAMGSATGASGPASAAQHRELRPDTSDDGAAFNNSPNVHGSGATSGQPGPAQPAAPALSRADAESISARSINEAAARLREEMASQKENMDSALAQYQAQVAADISAAEGRARDYAVQQDQAIINRLDAMDAASEQRAMDVARQQESSDQRSAGRA